MQPLPSSASELSFRQRPRLLRTDTCWVADDNKENQKPEAVRLLTDRGGLEC